MIADSQLEWVQKNRARKDRTHRVGLPIQQLVRQLETRAAATTPEILAAIADVADEEFRRHCRIIALDRKTLLVTVDDASMVYVMRLRWLGVLHSTLSHVTGFVRITFQFGCEGFPVSSRNCQGSHIGRHDPEPATRMGSTSARRGDNGAALKVRNAAVQLHMATPDR